MAIITGNNTSQTLNGTNAADTISARGGNDLVFGNAGNDILNGEDGNDTLRGGTGNDRLNGGTGIDTASYEGSSTQVFADLLNGDATSVSSGDDTLVSIENLTGSSFADQFVGNGGVNVLRGGAGDDSLDGEGGNDSLFGDDGNDGTFGGLGNDFLRGGKGDDVVNGAEGVDTGSWEDSTTAVNVDLLSQSASSASTGEDIVLNIENITGSNSSDQFLANSQTNVLRGLGGNDIIDAEAGNDTLDGGEGNDYLYASNGFDKLLGGNGTDTLNGGFGTDTMTGGAGADLFLFEAFNTGVGAANRDTITDFSHAQGDKIELSSFDANTGAGGNQAFVFKGTGAFTGAGQLRYTDQGSTLLVQMSTDGDAAPEHEILLTNITTGLVAGDFVL